MSWETLSAVYLGDPNRSYVLASLVSKKGSSYLQPGARMLVREDGSHWGGISAGCLEDSIAEAAVACLGKGKNRILEIDTRPFFGCYGEISVLLEILPNEASTEKFFNQVNKALSERAELTIFTDYSDLSTTGMTRIDKKEDGDNILVETLLPKPRVLVFGDWPDGQAVVNIARIMNWDVVAFDASDPGFSIEKSLAGMNPDASTAAVVMTHNFARDAVCLNTLLRLPLGYIGLIGSRKRREEISNELADGADMELIEALDRLHCPAGLDIGGEGHEAVALSVVAEIQAVLKRHDGGQLKNKDKPIHFQTTV